MSGEPSPPDPAVDIRVLGDLIAEWDLRPDGDVLGDPHTTVVPVRTRDGGAAVLKIGGHRHAHLALRRWAGTGAARLLSADPHRHAVLLERLHPRDLGDEWDVTACEIVAEVSGRLHGAPMPQLPALADVIGPWLDDLAALPRGAAIPHRLVEQAVAVGRDLATDPATSATLIHGNLHYGTVLAADREPWLAIAPRPINGDPHFEVAPMLWHRWDEVAGAIRDGVRRRFFTLVDAAGLSDERARDWVVLQMAHAAERELRGLNPDAAWVTTCVAVAKAVQG